MDKYRVAIVGAAGYAGAELVRLILGHPGFELVAATSTSDLGVPLAERYGALLGHTELAFCAPADLDGIDLDAVFLAVPHTAAFDVTPGFLKRGVSVIDLSADFRLKDAAVYEQWYSAEHTAPELLDSAVYGLPELYRPELLALAEQRAAGRPALVACPGCYPTASALAASPALAAGAMMPGRPLIINAVSGASGMGRSATDASHFVSVNEDARAYNVGVHRHTPEIEQTLSHEARQEISVEFIPHLIPMTRGLLATCVISLLPGLKSDVIDVIYTTAYQDEPFVQLLPHGQMPKTSSVSGTNNAHVGVFLDSAKDVLVACCAIDNLGKGASAQAVQCANVVFGLPETAGLDGIGLPV